MDGKVLAALLVAAAAGAGWFLGHETATGQAATGEGAVAGRTELDWSELEAEVARLRGAPGSGSPSLAGLRGDGIAGASSTGGGQGPAEVRGIGGVPLSLEPLEKFDLEGVESFDQLIHRFLRWAHTQLAKGQAGHLEILQMFGRLEEMGLEKRVEELVQPLGEGGVVKNLYPVVRYAMENDRKVLDLTETFLKQAAERPEWFEGMSDDPFELFTEGIGMMAPAVVDDTQLGRMRGYVQSILARSDEELPRALSANRRDLERLAHHWAPPLAPEEVLARVQSGELRGEEFRLLVRQLPSDVLAATDIPMVAIRYFEAGAWQEGIELLQRAPAGSAQAGARYDEALIRAMNDHPSDMGWWQLREWLRRTDRNSWAAARPFIERGLLYGPGSAERFSELVLQGFPANDPGADFGRWMLANAQLSTHRATAVRMHFRIE